MIYIHRLFDLTPKTMESECVQRVRDLRKTITLPIVSEQIQREIEPYFLGAEQEVMINHALQLFPVVEEKLKALPGSPFEPQNIQRALRTLKMVEGSLKFSLQYAHEVKQGKEQFYTNTASCMNTIYATTDPQQKFLQSKHLSSFVEKVLRHEEFYFNADGLVDEGSVEAIKSLHESIGTGFLFQRTMEDELKKRTFEHIRLRLLSEQITLSESIRADVGMIRKSIQTMYDHNLHMIELAITVYGFYHVANG